MAIEFTGYEARTTKVVIIDNCGSVKERMLLAAARVGSMAHRALECRKGKRYGEEERCSGRLQKIRPPGVRELTMQSTRASSIFASMENATPAALRYFDLCFGQRHCSLHITSSYIPADVC